MLERILYVVMYPVAMPYITRRIWKNMTPEQKALMLSKSTSEEEKDRIATQVAKELYPGAFA